MTPARLSQSWYRRLYVALCVGGLGYFIPYIIQTLGVMDFPTATGITLWSAVAGILVSLASGVLIFLGPKITSFVPAYIVYMVYGVTTALTVLGTGGLDAPLLPLWSLVLIVAPAFGAYGWLPGLVMIGSLVTAMYLSSGLTGSSITLIVLNSVIPLGLGTFLWRNSPSDDASNRNVKTLASQLSEVANRSEIIVNAIGDGVIAVDSKGVIELINPAAQEMLGWGKQDALMLNYKSVLKLDDENNNELADGQNPIQAVLNTNQQSRGSKITTVTKSGKRLFLSLVASPIGEPGSGAIIVFRDVTGERAEEREQAEFISTASHEMRTPVASIEGYLGLTLNPATATIDARAHDYIIKAHESAQHLGQLFQDLLDVSKSEDGRMKNNPKVVDVVSFVTDVVEGLQQKANEKNLDLVFVPNDSTALKKILPVYYVNLDNDHLREVLDNLIENAIKYTPKGQVRVDLSGTDDRVVISIKDTGLGIPPEDVPHLFQKFYRVNNADRQSIGGTGLGLYLCRRLVEAMQGRIWVESTFGNGSTFFVELPRLDSQRANELKQQQEQEAIQAAEANKMAEAAGITTSASVAAPMSAAASASTPAPTTVIPVTIAEASTTTAPSAVTQIASVTPQPQAVPQTQTAPQLQAAPQPQAATPQPQYTPQYATVANNTTPVAAAPPQAPAQPTISSSQSTSPSLIATGVRPATTVPRGETLTREQINERVRQLEELAKQQRNTGVPPRS